MKIKQCVLSIVCLCVMLGVCFCANPVMAADTLKIGLITPFKTTSGEIMINAAKLATEDINAAGGILGKKVELILGNTEYKPEKGAMAYKKLVLQDKCDAVIGTNSSGVAKSVMDQMARYKKVFISTGAASEALSDTYFADKEKYKYWFRVMHLSQELSSASLDFVYNIPVLKMGAKRMAIIAENALWTRGIVANAEKFFKEKGLEVVYSEFFDTETKDFTTILTKIMNAKAHYIYEVSAHVDGSIYIKQWYDLKGPMIGGVSGTSATDRYWQDSAGKAVSETNLCMGAAPVLYTNKSKAYYERYQKSFNAASAYPGGYTYDAFYVYKAAVEKAGTTDSDKVVQALEKTDWVGVAGRWVFDDHHNSIYGEGYRQLPMVQFQKDGSREVVWPKNLATAEFFVLPWQAVK